MLFHDHHFHDALQPRYDILQQIPDWKRLFCDSQYPFDFQQKRYLFFLIDLVMMKKKMMMVKMMVKLMMKLSFSYILVCNLIITLQR